jgi:hypothetical protein
MILKQEIEYLSNFPFCSKCFAIYIPWLEKNAFDSLENNDLIIEIREKSEERLTIIENILVKSREILNISETEFISVFGFNNDLLTKDHEKLHDILAEPIIAVNLAENGFRNIVKLPKQIKKDGSKIPCADFTAIRDSKKYAIELKTIRMENNPRPSPVKTMGCHTSYWWGMMLNNNIITKIEAKKQRVIKQLLNTKTHFDCDYTMLALYTRRIGPSTLMETDGYHDELTNICNKYDQIDNIFFKDYFGQILIIPD